MKGMIERPFAFCCAEAGGHVEACDCVNKSHGTAWFSAPRDSDGSGEAGETRSGSTEGDSAGRQASPDQSGAA